MLNKIGKIGKLNRKANRKLKALFTDKDIFYCEYDKPHACSFNMGLFFAHFHKRDWYKGKPEELLWSFYQVLLLCQVAHDLIEFDAKATKELFERVRGLEEIAT